MRLSIYIENNKLDLFKDETINLKSSVQDVNDITVNTTDYTKTFKVPASSNNNITFKHYYDASIDNTFDARTKVKARIEYDGIVFRHGKVTLNSVDVKNGMPSSYTIVFYGNLVNIKDKVKDDYLNVLDLSDFNHDYNSSNLYNGITTGLFAGDLVYPLLSKRQFYYNSNVSDNTNTNNLVNIAYRDSASLNGVRHSDIRPSIKLIRIIEAIEDYYGIYFSRDFFGRSEFTNIYLWLSPDSDKDLEVFNQIVDFNTGSDEFVNLTTNIGTFPFRYSNTINKRFAHSFIVTPVDLSTEYTVKKYLNGALYSSNTTTGVYQEGYTSLQLGFEYTGSNTINYDIYYEIESNYNFSYSTEWRNTFTEYDVGDIGNLTNTLYVTESTTQGISSILNINELIPKIKVIDLLKGLFQMYKLVVIQDNPNDPIYVDTLKDYYAEGVAYDLTSYIDSSSHTVSRGELLNNISYKFLDPETILNVQFKNNTGLGYGDEDAVLENEDGEPLDGSSLEIELPFEQVVYERLKDLETGVNTKVMYGAIIDESLEAINIKPHLHYIDISQIFDTPVALIDQENNKLRLDDIIVPSHTLGFFNPQHSLIFGAEFSNYTNDIILNTLYKNWHFDFISSIFNIKRRTFKYTAYNLPYRYLMSIGLNDVIQIKENFFRINSFTTNLQTGKVDFELINSFDNYITLFDTSSTIVIASARVSTESIYITNNETLTINKLDTGFGTDWVTARFQDDFLILDFEANTATERDLNITIQNPEKTKSKTITVIQLKA